MYAGRLHTWDYTQQVRFLAARTVRCTVSVLPLYANGEMVLSSRLLYGRRHRASFTDSITLIYYPRIGTHGYRFLFLYRIKQYISSLIYKMCFFFNLKIGVTYVVSNCLYDVRLNCLTCMGELRWYFWNLDHHQTIGVITRDYGNRSQNCVESWCGLWYFVSLKHFPKKILYTLLMICLKILECLFWYDK